MSRKVLQNIPLLQESLAGSTSIVLIADTWETGTFHNVFTVASSAAKTFTSAGVDIINNTVNSVAHGFATGRKIALTTGGTLPTGLTATDYWMIRVDVDTLKFAASLSDAMAGIAIDLTAIGTGTSTMTPAALSGCSIKLQESNDNSYFIDIASMTTTITVTGSSFWKPNIDANYIKLVFTITDGQVDFKSQFCAKG